jgi:hypothetical protein
VLACPPATFGFVNPEWSSWDADLRCRRRRAIEWRKGLRHRRQNDLELVDDQYERERIPIEGNGRVSQRARPKDHRKSDDIVPGSILTLSGCEG